MGCQFVERINIPGPLCWIPKVLKIGETHFLFCLLFDTVHDEAQWKKFTNLAGKVQINFVLISILQSPSVVFSMISALASKKWLILTKLIYCND